MAIAEIYAGTESITNDEWSLTTDTTTLATDTTDGIYQVWLDLSNLADGDVFIFRGYEKVQSTDSQRCFLRQELAGAQGETDNLVTYSFCLLHGWDFTLYKAAGTDRTITWSIRRVS